MVKGPSPAIAARLDTAIADVQFRDMPMADRPYLDLAWLLARMGGPEKARAMIARYRTEMTDTSLRRVQESALHNAQGEIALAEGKPLDAIAEYRRGDVASDGAPASECAACLAFDVARAYDAARRPDSATVYFERYLATPFWERSSFELDPVRVPAIRERLGQLYESMGNTDKAIENYRAFVESLEECRRGPPAPRGRRSQAARSTDVGRKTSPLTSQSTPHEADVRLATRFSFC